MKHQIDRCLQHWYKIYQHKNNNTKPHGVSEKDIIVRLYVGRAIQTMLSLAGMIWKNKNVLEIM